MTVAKRPDLASSPERNEFSGIGVVLLYRTFTDVVREPVHGQSALGNGKAHVWKFHQVLEQKNTARFSSARERSTGSLMSFSRL